MATHLTIEGRVQGVGYRASFAATAGSLQLTGWVRNRRDGAVEACVHGDAEAIAALLAWAKIGPPAAQVSHIAVTDSDEPAPADARFAILPTL